MSRDQSSRIGMVAACIVLLAPFADAAESPDIWSRIDSSRVCPVASVWRLGVGLRWPPAEMIETAVPLEVDGRAVWRIMHTMLRSPEDVRNGIPPGCDVYDIDRATLAPVQSEHRTRGGGDTPVNDFRADPCIQSPA